MKTTRLAAVIVCASIWATPNCQLYTHERVASMRWIGGLISLSEQGDYAYSAGHGTVRDPFDLYVNGVNYSGPLLPEAYRQAGPARFRHDGTIIWHAAWRDSGVFHGHVFVNQQNYTAARYGPASTATAQLLTNERGDIAVHLCLGQCGPADLWVGDRNVTRPVIPPNENEGVSPVALTEDGKLFWWGSRRFGNRVYHDWYYEDVNLSMDLLVGTRGTAGRGGHLFVNRSGQYAWSGQGDLTGRRMNVFLGQQNYSASVLGSGLHDACLIGIDEAGSIAWYGGGVRDVEVKDIYRNGENLSEFLAPTRKTSYSDPGMVSRSGHVLFGAGNYDLFLDRTNLSHELLGQERHAAPLGFAWETPLWFGWGTQDTGRFIGSHKPDPGIWRGPDDAVRSGRDRVQWPRRRAVADPDYRWLRPVAFPPGAGTERDVGVAYPSGSSRTKREGSGR